TVDLDDAAAGQAADAEGGVQRDRAGGDDLDGRAGVVAEPHDRSLAELAVDLGEGVVEGGPAILRGGLGGGLRCSHGVFLPEGRVSRRGDLAATVGADPDIRRCPAAPVDDGAVGRRGAEAGTMPGDRRTQTTE